MSQPAARADFCASAPGARAPRPPLMAQAAAPVVSEAELARELLQACAARDARQVARLVAAGASLAPAAADLHGIRSPLIVASSVAENTEVVRLLLEAKVCLLLLPSPVCCLFPRLYVCLPACLPRVLRLSRAPSHPLCFA